MKRTRFVSATMSKGSGMPALSWALRRLRGMDPEGELVGSRRSDNVTAGEQVQLFPPDCCLGRACGVLRGRRSAGNVAQCAAGVQIAWLEVVAD